MNDNNQDKKPLTQEELMKIMEIIAEAYKKHGKTVQNAMLYQGEEEPVMIYDGKQQEPN